ncbi:hypothetical protein C2G38_2189823 [Gigaspora rosea]|uniref:HCP-like protein n=1 Tax=Gigaspora rosea TaxID=44941 RepID=A0A397V954_9GLOM|nr:hypothetical protein C2G38_2189823 [Gigaspora rosea]
MEKGSEVIGTPREFSLIYEDCWCHDANKRPSIQYVVAHLNKIVIIEEFEEYDMEEDEIQLDQVDQHYNFSMIGYFHEYGIGTDVDYHKAFWMYKLSSEIDDVDMDKPLASKLFLDAAEIGQYKIASCYLCDDYVVEKDYIKSFEWYLKSAEGGNSDAQINVAKCYMNGC